MFAWGRCQRKFGPLIAGRHAGALSPAEAAALEVHLRDCKRCRDWETDMRELAEGIRRAPETDHPAPEKMAALFAGDTDLPADERTSIERHIERCDDCRAEWNVVTRWAPAHIPATVQPSRWRWFAGGAAAAAAAAALLFALAIPRQQATPDGRPALEAAARPVQIRGAHHRASGDPTPLPVSSHEGVVVIGLTIEAQPGSQVTVELRGAAGELVERAELTLDDSSGLLMFSVAASRLPAVAGEFRARIAGTGETFRYPFHVERSGD